MNLGRASILCLAVGLGFPPHELAAQSAGAGMKWPRPVSPPELSWQPVPMTIARQEQAGIATPTLLSLGVPGLGQLALERRRGWAYLAAEAVGWVLYVDRRLAGGDLRDQYRDLAWSEARLQTANREEAGFEYYETVSTWLRSGAFDADGVSAGIQPEADPTTYNGSIWVRASGLFGVGPSTATDDPSYLNAVAYYRDRAFGPSLLWDWTGSESEQIRFASLIESSDDRFRQATNVLGALIANHLLSAVDAYVTAKGMDVRARAQAMPLRAGTRWTAWARVPVW